MPLLAPVRLGNRQEIEGKMYFRVYDPKGEMFEVMASRLHDLIVERGWTFWHPDEKKDVFGDIEARTLTKEEGED
jgi:hypothetical protein